MTLENPDFYPDGRDLGENYTYTSWRVSPCVKSGKLDCVHCHTSSGRYRFKDEAKANDACLPCHAERVAKAAEHIHHQAGKPGVNEVHLLPHAHDRLCPHEPERPLDAPADAGPTMLFDSPNACNPATKTRTRPGPTSWCASGGRGITRRRSWSGPA